jgi:hypothetical protein
MRDLLFSALSYDSVVAETQRGVALLFTALSYDALSAAKVDS